MVTSHIGTNMTIDIIKGEIGRFLNDKTPEVMAIKGKWGVGKTYSWKKFLLEAKEDKRVCLNRYSYVSLFGLNSLDQFKYALFENTTTKNLIGTDASLDTLNQHWLSILEQKGRGLAKWFSKLPYLKEAKIGVESLAFFSIRRSIICIDDLERRGHELELRDVLGLVSLLKEEKKCKIVLLFNDGEDGFEEYQKYREKVIDIELEFNPTTEESAKIAFDQEDDTTEPLDVSVKNNLKESTVKLDINNIRILKKIERLVRTIIPVCRDRKPEILQQAIASLVLFSWCYYRPEDAKDIPNLDHVLKFNEIDLSFKNQSEDEEGQRKKKWNAAILGCLEK